MPAPTNSGSDFASIIAKAQTPPDPRDGGVGRDLPDGFPLPIAATHRIVDTANEPEAIPGAVAYDFFVKRKVFLVFRPWESCSRCQNDVASGKVDLPDDGDHNCPHTQIKEYEEVVNKCLAAEYILAGENEVNQKDGSIVVSLRWLEKKQNFKRMRQAAKERATAMGGVDL